MPASSLPNSQGTRFDPSLKTLRIGWIGTGVIGLPMAQHLLRNGFSSLTVYNRTPEKCNHLLAEGAVFAASPAEVAVVSDVVFSVVGDPSDVREVYTGPDGVFQGLRAGGVAIDCTTSSPELSRELADIAEDNGLYFVDAPVTGGDRGAQQGTLTTFVGGCADAKATVWPLLQCFSQSVWDMGGPGCGSTCKLANQIIMASNLLGMCEGMMFASDCGLDVAKFLRAIQGGSADSTIMRNIAPRLLQKNPAMSCQLKHLSKDVRLALDHSRKARLSLPSLAFVGQLYMSCEAHDEGSLGYQEIARSYERMNGRKIAMKR